MSSIPGLEDVTVEGLSKQQQTAQANGPIIPNQSQIDGPVAAPQEEVDTQTRTHGNIAPSSFAELQSRGFFLTVLKINL